MKEIEISSRIGNRNYGIDLLRILAMIAVVFIHCIGNGGILTAAENSPIKHEALVFLKIVAACAVNCYAIISGYVMYGRSVRYANIIYMLFQTMFYTLITLMIFLIISPHSINFQIVLQALFPLIIPGYWYLISYTCMFLFIPFINKAIDNFDKNTTLGLIVTILMVFIVIPTGFQVDFADAQFGCSCIWLLALYTIGLCVKKYHFLAKVKLWKLAVCFALCVVATWSSRQIIIFITAKIFGQPRYENYFSLNTSPTIFLEALMLVIIFSRFRLRKSTIRFVCYCSVLMAS